MSVSGFTLLAEQQLSSKSFTRKIDVNVWCYALSVVHTTKGEAEQYTTAYTN